jgi:hypothetical protein
MGRLILDQFTLVDTSPFSPFQPIKMKISQNDPFKVDAICYRKPVKLVKIDALLLVEKVFTEK